jgi:hypothetical protein
MSDNWNELSAESRQESMFQQWLNPQGVNFTNSAAEKAYKARVTRIKEAIQLKKQPDRTPVFPQWRVALRRNHLPAAATKRRPPF